MKSILVIYHGDCHDGFGAAYAAWRVLGDQADYHPGRIGEQIPAVDGKEVYILDFSYLPDKYEQILARAKSVTLIDHHASARDKLQGYPGTHFDMSHSGCMLAWQYFHPGADAPLAMKFIEDYDLWAWKHTDTFPFILNLKSYAHDFNIWDTFMNFDEYGLNHFIEAGKHIERHFRSEVDLCIKYAAREITFHGIDGYIINATKMFADMVGNVLAKRKNSFAIVWHMNEEGRINCSVRSVGDVSAREIAEAHGGGGHKYASRFNVENLKTFTRLFPSISM